MVGIGTGLFDDSPDGGLGMIMSALAGVAAALAVAIVLTIYFRSGYRSRRDLVKHGLAASAVLVLLAFVISDMRHAALAYLGINPAKPAVEFEIRLPKAALSAVADTQVELLTDRNQKLAQVEQALASTPDGRNVLKGTVTLDYRTTERDRGAQSARPGPVPVQTAAAREPHAFRLQFGPWHLADGVVSAKGDAATPRSPRRLRDPLSRALKRSAIGCR